MVRTSRFKEYRARRRLHLAGLSARVRDVPWLAPREGQRRSDYDVVEHFRTYNGPTNWAFDALDAAGRAVLCHDLEQLWSEPNRATYGTTRYVSEYREALAVRRLE